MWYVPAKYRLSGRENEAVELISAFYRSQGGLGLLYASCRKTSEEGMRACNANENDWRGLFPRRYYVESVEKGGIYGSLVSPFCLRESHTKGISK